MEHMVGIGYFLSCEEFGPRGRFVLGIGSGEALNEHVTAERWPPPRVRREMLAEAVQVIRQLHGGKQISHRGKHYRVENARVYTLPDQPVPNYISGFGPSATTLAAELGDGFCTVGPHADLVRTYRDAGGSGPVQGGFKVCWADSEDEGVQTAHRLWRNELLPGSLPTTLPTPNDYAAAASSLVTEDMMRDHLACGPDADRHIAEVRKFVDAGFDEVYVQQIGPQQDEFFDAWQKVVLPNISGFDG
jgi:G6PDH family F420-dependent oxidoreductase